MHNKKRVSGLCDVCGVMPVVLSWVVLRRCSFDLAGESCTICSCLLAARVWLISYIYVCPSQRIEFLNALLLVLLFVLP